MAEPPILSWEGLGLQQGGHWLFENLDLHIGPRDRLALIGRNGVGKTTLLRLIANRIEADRGERKIKPGTRIVVLEQDPDLSAFATLMDFALAGDDAPERHEVEAIAEQLGIDMTRPAETASGGERRRAALARALAQAPNLLLLDEPTNHLDLSAIEWLEAWLQHYKGAFIVVSHDRTFLKRLTRATLWLDRGTLRRKEVGFGGYEAWEEAVYAEEARSADKLDAKLKIEAHWLERGVTARRKRNQGRLEKLHVMRAQRAAMLNPQGAAKLALATDEESRSKTVINAEHVTKRFGERTIVRDFSLRIQRGDRIGLVGANGAGKTTLLKLLTGELAPDEGQVTLAKTLKGVMIDQQRALMQPERTVRQILAEGGDWIDVRGHRKHVQGYLKEFLFDPAIVDMKVGVLSGGERSASAARARVRQGQQPAGARRADQRPRPRDARPAAGSDRRLRGHGADRQPRPRLPRPHGYGDARARRLGHGRHRRRRLRGLGSEADPARPRRQKSPRRPRPHRRPLPHRRNPPSCLTRTSATTTCCRSGSRNSTRRSRKAKRSSPTPICSPATPTNSQRIMKDLEAARTEKSAAEERWLALAEVVEG